MPSSKLFNLVPIPNMKNGDVDTKIEVLTGHFELNIEQEAIAMMNENSMRFCL